jgi:hypothetical protein
VIASEKRLIWTVLLVDAAQWCFVVMDACVMATSVTCGHVTSKRVSSLTMYQ